MASLPLITVILNAFAFILSLCQALICPSGPFWYGVQGGMLFMSIAALCFSAWIRRFPKIGKRYWLPMTEMLSVCSIVGGVIAVMNGPPMKCEFQLLPFCMGITLSTLIFRLRDLLGGKFGYRRTPPPPLPGRTRSPRARARARASVSASPRARRSK